MNKIVGVILILCILLFTVACRSYEGYNTTNYLSIRTDNPQERILSIGEFSGNRTEVWEFEEATEVHIECMVEFGSLTIALFDSEDKLIFEKEVNAEKEYINSYYGHLNSGSYELKLSSRTVEGVKLRLTFTN